MIDDPCARSAALNMAIDETLLRNAHGPILRFYRWAEPAVSFGYFGRFDEAHAFADGRVLVRRWTGGGIVPHGDDVTYSLIISPVDQAFALSPREIYRSVHGAIARILRAGGVQASLAECDGPRMTDACFANPVVADVMEGGQKIAGAAQRKTRVGLLQQGSIRWPNVSEGFRMEMAQALSGDIRQQRMETMVLGSAARLAADKYSTDAWLRRR